MMPKLSKSDYIRIYTCMLEIRRFEERAAQLYGLGPDVWQFELGKTIWLLL